MAVLRNGSKPSGLPAFPQSGYLYCLMLILTEIPALMPHLKLSWRGRVWHGQEGNQAARGVARLAPQHPQTQAIIP